MKEECKEMKKECKEEKKECKGEWKAAKEAWKEEFRALQAQAAEIRSALRDTAEEDRPVLRAQLQELLVRVHAARASPPGPPGVLALARFVKDVTLPDGTQVLPGQNLVKTWRFRNEGSVPWPADARLIFISHKSDRLGAPDFVEIATPVAPGQEIDVSVPLVAPQRPGRYSAFFRLCAPQSQGRKFGQRVWVMLVVPGDSSSSDEKDDPAMQLLQGQYAEQLRMLAEMNFTNTRLNVRILRKTGGSMEAAIEKLLRKKQRCKTPAKP